MTASPSSPSATLLRYATRADAPRAIAFVRATVGAIFVSEGIQKFLFAEQLGAGRFARIGIPAPDVLAPFVGIVEILGGALLVVGLLTRLAAVPLLVNMLVAITSTKIVNLARDGFWKTAHEARTDILMIAGLVMLLAIGGGRLSVDARLRTPEEHPR
jgi:putative oxidoreductase